MRAPVFAFAVSMVAGCSGSGASVGGGGAADFVGSYSGNGTITYSACPDVPAPVTSTTGSTVTTGPSDGITTTEDGCTLNWTVSGDVASLVAGQTCSGSVNVNGQTVTYVSTWSTGTITLSGNTANVSAMGSAMFTTSAGMETCSFTQVGTGTKS
jgi:hypothetical protein